MTKKLPPKDDPSQSARFIQKAKELEAAGELKVTEAAKDFDAAFRKMVPAKRPPPKP